MDADKLISQVNASLKSEAHKKLMGEIKNFSVKINEHDRASMLLKKEVGELISSFIDQWGPLPNQKPEVVKNDE